MIRQVVRILVPCLLVGFTVPALAQPGDWQVLKYQDATSGPFDQTWCIGMNPRGDMVGYYMAAGLPTRGFLLSQGTYSTVQVPDSTSTYAFGINARGDIVGDYNIGPQEHGFVLRQGKVTTVDTPGKGMTHLRDINPQGDIVGYHMTPTPPQGFLLSKDGTRTEVQFPGAANTQPYGINPAGDIVGQYTASGKTHGFLRTKAGAMIALDFPGATLTSAWKINARGEVVGFYWDAAVPSKSHGFIWRDGVFEQKDYPDAVHSMIHGMNSEGEMCGMVSFTPLGMPTAWGGFSRTW